MTRRRRKEGGGVGVVVKEARCRFASFLSGSLKGAQRKSI